jgi:hypothetical protein
MEGGGVVDHCAGRLLGTRYSTVPEFATTPASRVSHVRWASND